MIIEGCERERLKVPAGRLGGTIVGWKSREQEAVQPGIGKAAAFESGRIGGRGKRFRLELGTSRKRNGQERDSRHN